MSDEYGNRWFEKKRQPFFGESNFGAIDKIFKEMTQGLFEEFSKATPKDLIREKTLPDGSKIKEWGPFVYGYSMTIGPDGKPQVREFGNVNPETRFGKPRINIKEQREPLMDIMQSDDEIKVIVELPGVKKEDIKLRGTEESLTISVDTPEKKYHKEAKLPTKVDTKNTKASYKNGVLEVTLQKKKASKGEPIML